MDKLDNTLANVESLITSGFGKRFHKVFDIPLLISNIANKRQAFAEAQAQKPDLKLPFAIASYSTLSGTQQRYAATPLLRRGIIGGATHDNVQAYRLRMLPVTTAFQITILSQDIETLRKFSHNWLFAATEGSMKFTVKYGIADIDVNVDMDPEIQFPQRAAGVNEPEEYELNTSIRLEGYINKPLEKAQTVNEVEATALLNEALAGSPKGQTQVFMFKVPK